MDEEDRIADCLASLAFCDEVVVVDSHSKDRTRALASELGARVIERDWPGHVAQKEFTIREARHDWVLCVDADERITPELRAEILALRDAGFPVQAGWRFPRLSSYLGRWMTRGGWYPDRQLRLFDRRRGHWGGNDPHDRVELDGPVGELRGNLLHHPYRSFGEHLRTIDKYTTIMAEGLHRRGERAGIFDLTLRPSARFFRAYVLKLGFLMGWRGLVQAYLSAYYGRLKYMKLRALQESAACSVRPTWPGEARAEAVPPSTADRR
ncbi:MAG: glycosyltransferase family 2 protein [Planctomycetes bacterium]|nr:glycosyltransferase family 2 protein [Planctomycetota bacterium]